MQKDTANDFFKTISIILVRSFLAILTVGCSLTDFVNKVDLPTNVLDPNAVNTREGALTLYNSVIGGFIEEVGGAGERVSSFGVTQISGLITDELSLHKRIGDGHEPWIPFEQRALSGIEVEENIWMAGIFEGLSKIRALSGNARGVISKYGGAGNDTLIAHLFAVEGMTIIYLADLFCSGVPLSTIDFEGDITLKRGLTTGQLYEYAISVLDSGLSLSLESERIFNLISVAKGRALLAIGAVSEGAHAVKIVPDSFRFNLLYKTGLSGITKFGIYPTSRVELGNRKGINGLPFGEMTDPRTQIPALTSPNLPLVISSGVEARLIEAEAALMKGDPEWINILNKIRTTCSKADECSEPYPAGAGGVPELGLLVDPVDSTARIKMLFDERAYWLLLTGHRQGDLRRLIRNYNWRLDSVYPIGRIGHNTFGQFVNIPVPALEKTINPYYDGCFNRDA